MNPPLIPTPAMIEAGAQRLVNWQDDTVWPDSFDESELRLYRLLAARCWREMWTKYVLDKKDEELKKRASVIKNVEKNDELIVENKRLREEIKKALWAMREFAKSNPPYSFEGVIQDPCGVHEWLKNNHEL